MKLYINDNKFENYFFFFFAELSLGLQALHNQAWRPIVLEDKPCTSSQAENSVQN